MAVAVTPALVPALADDGVEMEHDALVEDVGGEEVNDILRMGKARKLQDAQTLARKRLKNLAQQVQNVRKQKLALEEQLMKLRREETEKCQQLGEDKEALRLADAAYDEMVSSPLRVVEKAAAAIGHLAQRFAPTVATCLTHLRCAALAPLFNGDSAELEAWLQVHETRRQKKSKAKSKLVCIDQGLDVAMAYAWRGYDVVCFLDEDRAWPCHVYNQMYVKMGSALGATTSMRNFKCKPLQSVDPDRLGSVDPSQQQTLIYCCDSNHITDDLVSALSPASTIIADNHLVALEEKGAQFRARSEVGVICYTKCGTATPPVYPQVELAILILCRNRFSFKMWQAWSSKSSDAIGILAHTSGQRSAVPLEYRLVEQVPTSWGGIGCVYAEVRLLSEALRRYPNATHVAFLSESCVPMISCTQLLQKLKAQWHQ